MPWAYVVPSLFYALILPLSVSLGRTRGILHSIPSLKEFALIETITLCFFAFLAGMIDSIAGGGGLIQLPAMLVLLKDMPITTILGTNKMVAVTGTIMATAQYARKLVIDWQLVLRMSAVAFVCSFLGARVVSGISTEDLRPMIIVLLIVIALYIFFKKDLGATQVVRLTPTQQRWIGLLAGGAIGFYDGFFGPGTGTFLIFIFIAIFGLDFLMASASSKVVNVATNLAALIYFAFTGQILWSLALPMIVFNVGGAVVGSRLAMLKGSKFIRVLFLVVVSGIIIKLSYDTFWG